MAISVFDWLFQYFDGYFSILNAFSVFSFFFFFTRFSPSNFFSIIVCRSNFKLLSSFLLSALRVVDKASLN